MSLLNIFKRISNVLREHWERDHIAFTFEMVGMLFTVAGSLLMAITAKNPNMLVVYPLFLVGSATGLYAYYRSKMIWTIVLTSYFVVINTVGFIVAVA